ncbi:WD40-repeat-containing domain protein [Aspergillus aurantiobrunneus]
MVCSSSTDNTVRIWNAKSEQELQILQSPMASLMAAVFSPDNQMVASGSGEGTVRIWDTKTGSGLRTLRGHSDLVYTLAFSSDGQVLASGSSDYTIRLWDTKTRNQIRTLHGHQSTMFVAGSTYHILNIWDATTGTLRTTVAANKAAVLVSALKPSSTHTHMLIVWFCFVLFPVYLWVLWLPLEYRQLHCLATNNDALALGYCDGRVCIMKFHNM